MFFFTLFIIYIKWYKVQLEYQRFRWSPKRVLSTL